MRTPSQDALDAANEININDGPSTAEELEELGLN